MAFRIHPIAMTRSPGPPRARLSDTRHRAALSPADGYIDDVRGTLFHRFFPDA